MANTESLTVVGVDAASVLQALHSQYPDRNIRIVNERTEPSGSDILIVDNRKASHCNEIEHLRKLLEEKDAQMKEMEVNTKIAVQSIQTFHQQQQALYGEFTTLRQRYDDQKSVLMSTLWTHCLAHNPELHYIPKEESPTFIDTELQVGDYDVGEALGEGQFATVYTCRNRNAPERQFAIKVLKKERINNYNSLRRVSNEVEILRRLSSEYMIKIIDCIHTTKHLHIITELGGEDLFEFFDEHPDGVPESWAVEIIGGILKAVHFCHQNSICHRDLKPENILIEFDVEQQKCIDIKLCDFGLSTKFETGMRLSDFCGSPGFFAPEMITLGAYDGVKADVWSVGCVLLELLLGHERFCDVWMTAYEIETMKDKALFKEEVSRNCEKLPSELEFSDELCDFIVNVLRFDGNERYSSAQACQHPWLSSQFACRHSEKADEFSVRRERKNSDRVKMNSVRERELQHNGKSKVEPPTPSVITARKIIKEGNRLARLASNQYVDNESDEFPSGEDDEGI